MAGNWDEVSSQPNLGLKQRCPLATGTAGSRFLVVEAFQVAFEAIGKTLPMEVFVVAAGPQWTT